MLSDKDVGTVPAEVRLRSSQDVVLPTPELKEFQPEAAIHNAEELTARSSATDRRNQPARCSKPIPWRQPEAVSGPRRKT